ncbi:MAG: VirB3 family type IV secretion system protein [Endozoicomonadaceae bacterium]|nr:VirB3 family type IV secretion system protein [Endozoicomonadaceae bacterium]MCY4329364.1 VirB3 family type IV secretion system protein [Endozoicomonadaceae bacterium]
MRGEVRIHHSLIAPILLFGVPRGLAIANGTFLAATVLGLHTFWLLPVSILIHIVAVMLTKKDALMFKILLRHIKQKNYYEL